MSNDRTYTLIDPLQPHLPKETESAGVVMMNESGIATTKRAEVAQELKQRYPHMRVVEHEPQTGGRRTCSTMVVMPALPYETTASRRAKDRELKKLETSALITQGDNLTSG